MENESRRRRSQPLGDGNNNKSLSRHKITLKRELTPVDEKWNFRVPLPSVPSLSTLNTIEQDKIWVKMLSVTHEKLELSFVQQPTNRILAEDNPNSFLLVSFSNFRFLEEPPKVTASYIEKMLTTGIEINGITYNFYGHSNSQLKSRSVYLYAEKQQVLWKKIQGFGNFGNIASISKRAKRIGLLFSAAESSIQLDPKFTTDIEDIQEKGYNFTDGCGMISKRFAEELSKRKKIVFHNERYSPSVFQIRYKGYKGVLMMNPSLGEGVHAAFRNSMKKFSGCSSNTFCVLEYSKPFTYAYLNGELVTLLSSLGIPDEVFQRKQEEYFQYINEAMTNPLSAFKFLSYCEQSDKAEEILLNGLTQELKSNVRKAIKAEVNRMYKNNSDMEKVRILIPKSRILFGVADYTSTLNKGEVHVRISLEGQGTRTLDGAFVIVSRNPCLHPGDIRKFKAVRAPALEHLKDVIVFPTKGKRDPASLMSGGDLDGDKFFVSWDKDIIPTTMYEAYGYPAANEPPRRDIGYSDMIKYFANYNNASLGKVKNLYLEWVRSNPKEKAGSKQCQELNKLFSSCVDGEPIKIPAQLDNPPEPPPNTPPFIVDDLCKNVGLFKNKLFGNEETENLLVTDFLTSSIDLLYALLTTSLTEACLVDEFEMFQLSLRWCDKNPNSGIQLEHLLPYFDFGSFTTSQKHIVLDTIGNAELKTQYLAPVWNGLYNSNIITVLDLRETNLHTEFIRWQKLYSSFEDGGSRLYLSLDNAMEHFDKKILVFTVDSYLKIAIYIPRKIEKMKTIDVGSSHVLQTSNRKQKFVPTVKLFAFETESGKIHKSETVADYKLSYDGEIIQLYEKQKRNSFVWFALNENWRTRNGLITKENTQFKVSIALQKFSKNLSRSHSRVTKQESAGFEIYVLSNRDRIGHQILDITDSLVQTTEIKKIVQNMPKDWSIPINDPPCWMFREYCEVVLSDGDMNKLNELKETSELEQIFNICIEQKYAERLFQILEFIITQGRGELVALLTPDMILNVVKRVPETCVKIIPAILNSELGNINFGNVPDLIPTIVIAILIISNDDMKEICSTSLFPKILPFLKVLGPLELIDLVKRIIFTVRHADVAEEFILSLFQITEERNNSKEMEYMNKFILSLSLDYIGKVKDTCPVDYKGVPLGAEEFCKQSDAKKRSRIDNRLLSEFFETDENEKSRSGSSKNLEPVQICLDLTSDPENHIYKTTLRTDVPTTLKVEDHVRFCATKPGNNDKRKKITVIDGIVKSNNRGLIEFHILQLEPIELELANWNVYLCESTTNLMTQFQAIKTLLKKQTEATVGYNDICGIPLSDAVERIVEPKPLKLDDQNFNPSQVKAINTAVNSGFTLIWGPPGTGKTTVIVEIILQFLQVRPGLKFLITASTHNAVDNVMNKFLKNANLDALNLNPDEIIRLTSDVSKVNTNLKTWTLDAFIGKSVNDNNDAKRKAIKRLKNATLIFSTCSGAGVGLLRESDNDNSDFSLEPYIEDEEIDISEKKTKKRIEHSFDVVIIDEASQITEPNALIPIVKKSKFVILVGDHVQLCPTVTELGKEFGLHTSLFEKLYKNDSTYSVQKVMLDVQYRMHPKLALFPSNQFYDGKLKSGVKAEERQMFVSKFTWPDNGNPCVFIHCDGPESYGSSSKENHSQVKCTLELLKLLKTDTKPMPKIVILTPYSKQKDTLCKQMSSNQYPGVEVNTIDGFQGREADIIIFNTVRSNNHGNLGFLEDSQRINVALTRAKYGIIIIGNKLTLFAAELTRKMIESAVESII